MAWATIALATGLAIAAVGLAFRNGSFSRDPFIYLLVGGITTYAVVGGLLALRVPRNPIGWLLLIASLGLLLSGAMSEYAVYALVTAPGTVPLGTFAAWVSTWTFPCVVGMPLVLVLFPDGHVPSRSWRWLPAALIASAVMAAIGTIFAPGVLDVTTDVQPQNPYAITSLDTPLHVLAWIGGLGLALFSILAVVALIQRYRAASPEERQQVRWLASAGIAGGIALVAVLVTSIGIQPGETRPLNDLAFLLFWLCIGFGIPAAVGVATLRYRLYELDLVIKKTVVFVLVVIALMALAFVVGLIVTNVATPQLHNERLILFVGLALGILVLPLFRLSTRIADRLVYGGRATPYEVLTEFGERMSDTYSTEDVLPRTAQLLASATGAKRATVWLSVGRELRCAAVWPADTTDATTIALDGDELPWLPADWATEVRDRGELVGALAVDMPASDPIGPGRQRLVRDLAAQTGLAIRNVRLVEDLRASRRRIVATQDARAKSLERNIHDGAQQQLVALTVKERLLATLIAKDPARAQALAEELQTDTTAALENLRDLARGIYPPLLADQGLTAALEAQARKATIPTTVLADGVGRFSQEIESAVYFSCLEAMQNIAKYAHAATSTIRVADAAGHLQFEVTDDGVGFDPAMTTYGTGLQGIADRLAALGGALDVQSGLGSGTTLIGTVPV